MKVTKRYLKLLTMGVLIACFCFSATLAGLLGVVSVVGVVAADLISALKSFGAAAILGFMATLLWDLLSWLDQKFKPY